MDVGKKLQEQNTDQSCEPNDAENKRENRLTSIIDQLLSRSREVHNSNHNSDPLQKAENPPESDPSASTTETTVRSGTPSSSAGSGRQRKKKARTNNNVNGLRIPRQGTMPSEAMLVESAHPTHIKAERFSPDIGGECSSRSGSSGSPASPSRHPRPPSYPGTPPTVPISTPLAGPERFSPAAATSGVQGTQQPLKQMEQMMSRNYSDFMRSLAAKYNNSNPNEYFGNRNGFLSGLDGRFGFKPGSSPLLGLSPFASPLPTKEMSDVKKNDIPAPSPLISTNFSNFPLIDMSSTQALLNMVRSASAQSASQLETYLKGSTNKRPHEATTATSASSSGNTTASSSPLDLSSVSKKPRGEGRVILRPPNPSEHDRTKDTKSASPKPPRSSTSNVNQCISLCTSRICADGVGGQEIAHWNVDDVCSFVASIDLCSEYVEAFRSQSIDGAALPLLTEEHLTNNMNMKLGPALKFRSVLASRIGHCAFCMHCVHCHGVTSGTSISANTKEIDKRPASVGN